MSAKAAQSFIFVVYFNHRKYSDIFRQASGVVFLDENDNLSVSCSVHHFGPDGNVSKNI